MTLSILVKRFSRSNRKNASGDYSEVRSPACHWVLILTEAPGRLRKSIAITQRRIEEYFSGFKQDEVLDVVSKIDQRVALDFGCFAQFNFRNID